MAELSGIEWTDSTFNPWIGCQKVSPACDNCYAETWAARFGMAEWGPHAARVRTTPQNWNKVRKWNREADAWATEHGRPRFVFCASLADVFDNAVPSEWRDDLWNLIRECDQLVWLLLTKRPQNIAKMLPSDWGDGWGHVWLGATVEDQKRADQNIPPLLRVPAARRFLSCEPMVGPINLRFYVDVGAEDFYAVDALDWIIAGGESGPGARLTDADWYRSLRDQAQAFETAFHFKQWGEYDADRCRVGKKNAGRLLDGRTWDERPATA